MGKHLIKHWCKEQGPISLSSGEAELYAVNRAASEGLGLQSLARDYGWNYGLSIELDAAATQGILQRRGLGKTRHIDVRYLWTQQALKEKKFTLKKIESKHNTADIGTKPLAREPLEHLLDIMGFSSPTCH